MRWVIVLVTLAGCRASREAPRDASPAPTPAPAPALADDPWSRPDVAPVERPLTEGELALVRPIFKTSIDYAKVRVIHGRYAPFQPGDVCMTPRGKIYCPGDNYHDDFSAADVPMFDQSGFVHEMTHVWQYENGTDLLAAGIEAFNRTGGDYTSIYSYQLEPVRDLTTYGFEQQAAIVEDWFVLETYHMTTQPMIDLYGDRLEGLYDVTMKQLLADPGYARTAKSSP